MTLEIMTSDPFELASRRLKKAGCEASSRMAARLLANMTNLSTAHIMSGGDIALTDKQINHLKEQLDRLILGEPLARILGKKEFWGLDFCLNEATLDPRPDSETLIEIALSLYPLQKAPRVLDLGTGSGCLLLSLLHEWPLATGLGTDIAPRALEAAHTNAKHLNLSNRAHFIKSDWFEKVEGCFDLIISNPPYIAEHDKPMLSDNVLGFDPHRALFGGFDGLDAHRAIARSLKPYLTPHGLALVEIGYDQGQSAADIYHEQGLNNIRCQQDLAGHDRVLIMTKAS